MAPKTLIESFSQALKWNALLHITYKSCYLLRSLYLFHTLPPHLFSLWANNFSIIFITLLWLDAGLRKSIPYFLPSITNQQSFIKQLIFFQTIILFLASPILGYALYHFNRTMLGTSPLDLVLIGILLFILEGIASISRLISHTQSRNKWFNLIESMLLIVQMIIDGIIILSIEDPELIIKAIFVSHATTVFILLLLTCKTYSYAQNNSKGQTVTRKEMVQHTAAMWGTTIIKSITERNIIVPLLTYSIGIDASNLFKVANDGALVLYRLAIKTIGTSDTSLLAGAQRTGKKRVAAFAFQKLSTQASALCIPLVGIMVLMIVVGVYRYHASDYLVFQLFFIMGITYILEIMMLPYERLLECERHYNIVYACYAPYFLIVILYGMLCTTYTSIGLFPFVSCIQGVRLVSNGLLVFAGRRTIPYTVARAYDGPGAPALFVHSSHFYSYFFFSYAYSHYARSLITHFTHFSRYITKHRYGLSIWFAFFMALGFRWWWFI